MPFICGQSGITVSGTYDWDYRDDLTKTTQSLYLYVNASTGDDANDGLTTATAKKTISATLDIIPEIISHNCFINCSGIFTENFTVSKRFMLTTASGITSTPYLVFDGGFDNVSIKSGPHLADIVSASGIGITTLGTTTDNFAGYWVDIISGTGVGQRRLVHSNNTTTLVTVRNWTTTPVSGNSSFQIVEPTTALNGLIVLSSNSGNGYLHFQNFMLHNSINTTFSVYLNTCLAINLTGCISKSTANNAILGRGNIATLNFSTTNYLPNTTTSKGTISNTGVSIISDKKTIIAGSTLGTYYGSYLRNVELTNCFNTLDLVIDFGTRIKGKLEISGITSYSSTSYILSSTSVSPAYRTTQIDTSSTVGIKVQNSLCRINSPTIVQNHSSHGVEARNCLVELNGAISGSGNGGAGVYAHSNAIVLTKSGTPPTITGTVGNTTTDGTTPNNTWSVIDSGTQIADITQFTIIKKQ